MRIESPAVATRLAELGVELRRGVSLRTLTSLGIGGETDILLLRRYEGLPEVISRLKREGIPYRFLGGGTNVLVVDGELPWVMLQLPSAPSTARIEGNRAYIDAAADLGGTVTY
jgi:UDP-N-acetylenolpyruvoylglucosamine reductase